MFIVSVSLDPAKLETRVGTLFVSTDDGTFNKSIVFNLDDVRLDELAKKIQEECTYAVAVKKTEDAIVQKMTALLNGNAVFDKVNGKILITNPEITPIKE